MTAHATDPVAPQVTKRSTDRILIGDPGDGPDAYEVSYTVKGTREGYADETVVPGPSERDGDDAREPGADAATVAMQPDAERARDDSDQSGGESRGDDRRRSDDTGAVDLRGENEELRAETDRLRERNAALEARLDRLEAHVGLADPDVADGKRTAVD